MDESLPAQPSMPMTGPSRRQLPQGQSQGVEDMAGYLPPSDPLVLQEEASPLNRFGPLLARRKLDLGPRRLF